MADIFKQLKLVRELSLDVAVPRREYVRYLNKIVDSKGDGVMTDALGTFSKSKSIYRGWVREDGFLIRNVRRFMDPRNNMSVAKGKISDINGGQGTRVNVVVSGLTPFFNFFYLFLLVVYFGGIAYFIFVNRAVAWGLPVLIAQGFIMALFPYVIMRRSVRMMVADLKVVLKGDL
jgi:hypothetical protein